MKKIIFLVVIAGMFGWAVYDLAASKEDTSNTTSNTESKNSNFVVSDEYEEELGPVRDVVGLNKGNAAPDFTLETLDGEQVNLSDFRGQRVMLNFWATWCPPCRAEMPDMEKFHQDKDVVILAVNLTQTENNIEKVQKFIKDYKITFPILLDKETTVANMYGIQPIPSSFMIDSEGIIQFRAFGALNYDLMVQEFEKMK